MKTERKIYKKAEKKLKFSQTNCPYQNSYGDNHVNTTGTAKADVPVAGTGGQLNQASIKSYIESRFSESFQDVDRHRLLISELCKQNDKILHKLKECEHEVHHLKEENQELQKEISKITQILATMSSCFGVYSESNLNKLLKRWEKLANKWVAIKKQAKRQGCLITKNPFSNHDMIIDTKEVAPNHYE